MFSFYERFYCQAKQLVIQLEKVKMKYPMFSFEREFRNTVTYHSRLLRAVKQIIGRGCSAKHCEQIYKVNRSWDTVLNNSYRVYPTCSILSAIKRLKTKGLSCAWSWTTASGQKCLFATLCYVAFWLFQYCDISKFWLG